MLQNFFTTPSLAEQMLDRQKLLAAISTIFAAVNSWLNIACRYATGVGPDYLIEL